MARVKYRGVEYDTEDYSKETLEEKEEKKKKEEARKANAWKDYILETIKAHRKDIRIAYYVQNKEWNADWYFGEYMQKELNIVVADLEEELNTLDEGLEDEIYAEFEELIDDSSRCYTGFGEFVADNILPTFEKKDFIEGWKSYKKIYRIRKSVACLLIDWAKEECNLE